MPTLPDTFLGKVRLTSLRRLVDVEAELRARDITGWVARSEGGKTPFRELRARLPTYTEGEGEGAVEYLEGGRMGDITPLATALTTAVAPAVEYADEVGDKICCIM